MGALTGPFVYPAPLSLLLTRGLVAVSSQRARLAGLSRGFAVAVVFIAGWYLCLPESEFVRVPWWASKLAIGPNILVHEAVLAVYLVLGGTRLIVRSAFRERYLTLSASLCLVALAVWCATTSLLAPYPAHDAGRSARLILMALMLLGVTHWAARDPLLVLRAFLLGLAGGSLINLGLTFQNPLAAGLLPRLLGQNAPGPPMGIAVCLAAWLILLSRSPRDTVIAIVAALICGSGAMISYSKTGMLAAAMGFVSIAVIAGRVMPSKRGGVLIISLVALVLGATTYVGGEARQRIWSGFSAMVREKIGTARFEESASMQERWSYVLGVSEIVLSHPLGVGYSGFRDAMMGTEAYRLGRSAADERSIGAADSNPHSLFLYYASAGGVVGGILAVVIFTLLCRVLWRGLGPYGSSGVLLALSCGVAYLVLAISVPYLFNSSVMLIPVGFAAGIHARAKTASGGAGRVATDRSTPISAS